MIGVGVCVALIIAGSVSGFNFNRKYTGAEKSVSGVDESSPRILIPSWNIDPDPDIASITKREAPAQIDLVADTNGPILKDLLEKTTYRETRDIENVTEKVTTTTQDVSTETSLVELLHSATTEISNEENVTPKRRKFQEILEELYGPLTWQDPAEESNEEVDYEDPDDTTAEPPGIQIDQSVLDKVFGGTRIIPKSNTTLFHTAIFSGGVNMSDPLVPEGNATFNMTGFDSDDRFQTMQTLMRTWEKNSGSPPSKTVEQGHNEITGRHLIINFDTSKKDTIANNSAWNRDTTSLIVFMVLYIFLLL